MIASLVIIIMELSALVLGVWFLWCLCEHNEIRLVPLAIFVVLMLFVAFR